MITNFSIVMSGGCNAKCNFCTDSFTRPASPDYLRNLVQALKLLPDYLDTCSITGGEPTLSKNLLPVLGMVKGAGISKVVLTTNGAKLLEVAPLLGDLVSHVNLSRHAIGYEDNIEIFGTKDIGDDNEIKKAVIELEELGIDTTINHVYDEDLPISEYVYDFIDYAKSLGARTVCFRNDHCNNSLQETTLEKRFNNCRRVSESTCPVCRSHEIYCRGISVVFKAAFEEPSNELQEPYELIYHITGRLTTDWAGEHEYEPAKAEVEDERNDQLEYIRTRSASCGGRGPSC